MSSAECKLCLQEIDRVFGERKEKEKKRSNDVPASRSNWIRAYSSFLAE